MFKSSRRYDFDYLNVFGRKTLVERINIVGNTITNEEVVRGELILDEETHIPNLI